MAQEKTANENPKAKPEAAKAMPQESAVKQDHKIPAKETGSQAKTAQKPESASRPADSKPATKPSAPASQEHPQVPAKPVQKPAEPARQEKPRLATNMKLFNRWDISEVTVRDEGLAGYINLNTMIIPRSGGKYGASEQWGKNKMSVVERFMNRLQNTGHRGKKHKISSGNHAGKIQMLYRELKEAFIIIEKRTKKNPVQILVDAIENSGPLEEVASYRMGGIIARNSVITSPQRRLDLALRHLTQGIYRTSFRNKRALSSVIADELITASTGDSKSFAVSERNRLEKEAEGAR
jgi:small subunit ribosomal protein S7